MLADAALRPPQTKASLKSLRWLGATVGTVLSVGIAIVGTLALVLAIGSHLAPEGEYTAFGHPALIVLSGSMSPVIRTGDLIWDDPVSATQATHLHVGQIITFRTSGHTTHTHRVVAVHIGAGGAASYTTKGDANNGADTTPVLPSAVVGTFAGRMPRGGYLLDALHRPLVLGLILASPILWFLSVPLYQMARDMEDGEAGKPAGDAGGDEGGGR